MHAWSILFRLQDQERVYYTAQLYEYYSIVIVLYKNDMVMKMHIVDKKYIKPQITITNNRLTL